MCRQSALRHASSARKTGLPCLGWSLCHYCHCHCHCHSVDGNEARVSRRSALWMLTDHRRPPHDVTKVSGRTGSRCPLLSFVERGVQQRAGRLSPPEACSRGQWTLVSVHTTCTRRTTIRLSCGRGTAASATWPSEERVGDPSARAAASDVRPAKFARALAATAMRFWKASSALLESAIPAAPAELQLSQVPAPVACARLATAQAAGLTCPSKPVVQHRWGKD